MSETTMSRPAVPHGRIIGGEGVAVFIRAYRDAPPDADIEVAVSQMNDGMSVVRASIVGSCNLILDPPQARILAEIFADAHRMDPFNPELSSFKEFVTALRDAANQIDMGN